MATTTPKSSSGLKRYWPFIAAPAVLITTAILMVMVARDPGMYVHERWNVSLAIGTLGVGIAGVLVVYYQLHQHRIERAEDNQRQLAALEADHDRRKKEATLQHLSEIRTEWRAARDQITDLLGEGVVSPDDVRELFQNDPEKRAVFRLVRNFLALVEYLCTGVNTDVLDADLLYATSGSFLIGIHQQLEHFIRKVQQDGKPTYYREFDELVQKFKARQAPPPQPPAPRVRRPSDGYPKVG